MRRYIFNGASSFYQNISEWDVSNVTNMSYMFYYSSSFNEDVSGWDVSNVKVCFECFEMHHRFFKT